MGDIIIYYYVIRVMEFGIIDVEYRLLNNNGKESPYIKIIKIR